MKMNITWLKMPSGRRQTSWLFTNVAEELNASSFLGRHRPGTSDPNVNFLPGKDVIVMQYQILRTGIKRTVRYLVRRIDKIV